MRLRSLLAGSLAALALVVAACATARRGEPLAGPTSLSAEAAQGQIVFMHYCQPCHPGGEAGLGPALNNKPFPAFLKRFQVRHGLGAMPSFTADLISEEQLDQLMAYLAALRKQR